MRLKKYKVTKFRSVQDSDWIETDAVTAFIGINESGKSNLLLPLWKLNPAGSFGEIDHTADYPKTDYQAIRQNSQSFKFITAHFEIGELAEQLEKMTSIKAKYLDEVEVCRFYDGHYDIAFPNYVPIKDHGRAEVEEIILDGKANIEKLNVPGVDASLKAQFVEALNKSVAGFEHKPRLNADDLEELRNELLASLPEGGDEAEDIAVPHFKSVTDTIGVLASKLRVPLPSEIETVRTFVVQHIPKFVYYSNFGNLDSEIYLPHVIDNLKRTDVGAAQTAKARTLRILFSFVGLKPEEILQLGRDFRDPQNARQPTPAEIEKIATNKKDRTNLLNAAGTKLTKNFRDWWKQGDYIFRFQADGDHFRIWVSDTNRPEEVELEHRSNGLQWFFSFYLVFLVEREGEHTNAILLLDEPGLSLHPLAQRDLSEFFDGLASANQLIYTTHSPFLIDADMLDRARKVYADANHSTKASADLRRGSDDPPPLGSGLID